MVESNNDNDRLPDCESFGVCLGLTALGDAEKWIINNKNMYAVGTY